ncbi:MAG: VWA domain-containing protein, partial [Gammaproteobacteria bacterium]|nr:VWA domain-containing protein [Gammaproteobacteria bacterium]
MQKYIIILLLGLLLIHCATTTESTFDDEQATAFDSASTAFSPQGSGGGFGVSINGPSSIDGNFGGAGTCYSDEVKQETNVVNLVFLLDRSASMSGFMWDNSINELEKFINDPKSSGINVALSYFPAIPFDAHC